MLKSITMNTQDFIKIPDNPIQRDTIRRAAVYSRPGGHLEQLHPTMLRVSIAQTAGGKKVWKLDGHTRAHLWESEAMQVPDKVFVDVFEVQNEQQAMDYYLNFDSPLAHESGQDRLSGALRYHKFQPQHKAMFKSTGLIRAIDYLIFPKAWKDIKHLSMVQKVKPWLSTMRVMDSMESFYLGGHFPSVITAAMMLSVRRDSTGALEFWQLYHDDAGKKHAKTMDGVQRARELFAEWRNPTTIEMYKNARRAAFSSVTPKFLHCYEQWMDGKRFDVKVGTGRANAHWETMLSPGDWWTENLGEFDHPEIRQQEELELG